MKNISNCFILHNDYQSNSRFERFNLVELKVNIFMFLKFHYSCLYILFKFLSNIIHRFVNFKRNKYFLKITFCLGAKYSRLN